MKRALKWMIGALRSLFADMLSQVITFFMLIFAGFAWFHFSTPFAVIPVIVIGIMIDVYLYDAVEGDTDKKDGEEN